MVIDMTKSVVKPKNILRTLKEHNDKNVTTIKQVYSARTTYRRSLRGPRIEMQHLMFVIVYSVMPLMVYVFPLLVCPYAKMLADQLDTMGRHMNL